MRISDWSSDVCSSDLGKVELADGRRKIRFDPQRLSPTEQRDRLQLSEKKDLHLREGDRIRWTANDKERGLLNAALARVIGIDAAGVTVETADRSRLTLDLGDPMLSRLDLAYRDRKSTSLNSSH